MNLISKIKAAIALFQNGGIAAVGVRINTLKYKFRLSRQYRTWIRTKGAVDPRTIRDRIAELTRQPKISVILPVYNVDEKWLTKCIESVRNQIYPNWELCIADDASPSPHIKQILKQNSNDDPRIKVVFRETNGHISAASNSALELATGEFAVLLDHDDELSADAFFWVAKTIVDEPTIAMIFSDEDLIDEQGRRSRPAFKPDWSRDLFYSLNLITHLSAYRTDVLRQIGGFRVGMEGSQDYDLALRVIETIDESQIKHIPRILYHWRAIPGSVALSGDEKPYAHECARIAIREHLERTGKLARVEATEMNLHRVRYAQTAKTSRLMVAIVGPMDNAKREFLSDPSIASIQKCQRDGNLGSSLYRSVEQTDCDVICLLDADIKSLPPNWLRDLVSFLEIDEIGAVGGKLVDEAGRIVDGPLYLDQREGIQIANHGLENDFHGNMLRNKVVGNYSAVSLSLMAIRVSDLKNVGSFNNALAGEALIDADLCLRLVKNSKRIVSVPFVEGTVPNGHRRTQPRSVELEEFKARWTNQLEVDPFSNPNLVIRNRRSEIDV